MDNFVDEMERNIDQGMSRLNSAREKVMDRMDEDTMDAKHTFETIENKLSDMRVKLEAVKESTTDEARAIKEDIAEMWQDVSEEFRRVDS